MPAGLYDLPQERERFDWKLPYFDLVVKMFAHRIGIFWGAIAAIADDSAR